MPTRHAYEVPKPSLGHKYVPKLELGNEYKVSSRIDLLS